jgi:hypothetical protein
MINKDPCFDSFNFKASSINLGSPPLLRSDFLTSSLDAFANLTKTINPNSPTLESQNVRKRMNRLPMYSLPSSKPNLPPKSARQLETISMQFSWPFRRIN